MPNLRIVSRNLADGATLTASSEASADTAVANLKSDKKGDVWRAVGTTALLSAVLAADAQIGIVGLPFCNLSPTATVRVRCYSDAAMTVLVYDSGAVSARTVKAELEGFTDAQAASAYAYGGGSYATHWMPKMTVRAVSVEITDAANLQGYIEVSRLVIGDYWEPQYNADYGASVTPVDTSKHTRTESGDLSIDIGTKHRKLSLQLSHLTPTDRAALFRILRSSGMTHPVWLSVFPGHADVQLEHDHQIFGALANTAAMSIPGFERYQSTLELEEV